LKRSDAVWVPVVEFLDLLMGERREHLAHFGTRPRMDSTSFSKPSRIKLWRD
jgi:hypothetical protein